MHSEKLEIRIPALKLLIAALVLITPICLVGLISISRADRAVATTVGTHFRVFAEISASEVSGFIHDSVMDVGVMAMQSDIVAAVVAANKAYEGKAESTIEREIQNTEKIWATSAAQPLVSRILSSPASRSLRKHREIDKRFLRMTVTDARGVTVAASHKTLDYYQADEEFWQNIYAGGRGSISLTDVLYDSLTKSQYIGIGVPILEEQSNRFIGALDVLLDVSSILPVVQRMQLGPSSRLMLVKEDGTVIASPRINLAMNMKSAEYAAVKDSASTASGIHTGYVVADMPNGEKDVIGFADTGLKKDYGNLGWMVLAAQNTRESFAPVRAVGRWLALMSLLGLIAVTVFGVYVSLHRKSTYPHVTATEGPGSVRSASA
ncbi:MAG: cache domain-containing protein [Bryobacteraceae bacterium]|nr:cache domain-containing protein [Bryobacterales bacterium]MEB2361125.1 cache domain-containing protein [Bryobacterales bacterium]NUM99861.1 cache domain-containing protein [Bryobacteraceae bacterium]